MTQSSVQFLRDARKLITDNGWTQNAWARNASGNAVPADHPDAVCFCVAGALKRVAIDAGLITSTKRIDSPAFQEACNTLVVHTRTFPSIWNDMPERTQPEVLRAFTIAIEDLTGRP